MRLRDIVLDIKNVKYSLQNNKNWSEFNCVESLRKDNHKMLKLESQDPIFHHHKMKIPVNRAPSDFFIFPLARLGLGLTASENWIKKKKN